MAHQFVLGAVISALLSYTPAPPRGGQLSMKEFSGTEGQDTV